jgi:hypothetical protein
MDSVFKISMSIFDTIKIIKEKISDIIDSSSTKITTDNTNITSDLWQFKI